MSLKNIDNIIEEIAVPFGGGVRRIIHRKSGSADTSLTPIVIRHRNPSSFHSRPTRMAMKLPGFFSTQRPKR
jgi:hypothetical protein